MNRLGRRLGVAATGVFAALCFSATSSLAGVVAYTDRAAFLAAVGADVTADDFESYALGAVANSAALGDFQYSFAATVQPAVVPGGFGGQGLGGPFDVFVGGDAFSLAYGGAAALRAFGLSVLYAPSFDTIAADLYRVRVGDGVGAGAFVGNPVLDAAGGAFFLGLVAEPGSEFRQIDLFSVVPVDANGDPVLVPAYQFDDFAYAAPRAASVPVPEPHTLGLVLTATALLAAWRRISG